MNLILMINLVGLITKKKKPKKYYVGFDFINQKRLEEINDGSFVIEDAETERLNNL
mgnify:CR=1